MTIQKEPSDEPIEAIKKVENWEVESYKNYEEFKKVMLDAVTSPCLFLE